MIRAGLTLVETLAATVLLAAVAVAVVPLIADASRRHVPGASDGRPDLLDLTRLAESMALSPSTQGLDGDGPWVIEWPSPADSPDSPEAPDGPGALQRDDWPPVEIEAIEVVDIALHTTNGTADGDADRSVGGRWLVFRCGGDVVVRWAPTIVEEGAAR